MALLIVGLVVFLGVHMVQAAAGGWRAGLIARVGEGPYKGLYSGVSLAGFVLIVWGFGIARHDTVVLWTPPGFAGAFASILNLAALIFIGAFLAPAGRLKAAVGHPMVIGTILWAVGHLIANGTLADVVLFGAFLAWAAVDLVTLYARDRAAAVVRAPGPEGNDAIAAGIGIVLWGAFILFAHRWLFGVSPL